MMKFRDIIVKEIEREMANIRACPASEDSYKSLLEIEQVIGDEDLNINIEWLKQEVYYSRYRSGLYIPEDEVISVDLGLPSGNRWCLFNVGSNNETGPGIYYGWNEIKDFRGVPNNKDFQELSKYTAKAWTTDKSGLFFTSRINPSNYMYIPMAGFYNIKGCLEHEGVLGLLWTSTNNDKLDFRYGYSIGNYINDEPLIKATRMSIQEKLPIRKIWNLEIS